MNRVTSRSPASIGRARCLTGLRFRPTNGPRPTPLAAPEHFDPIIGRWPMRADDDFDRAIGQLEKVRVESRSSHARWQQETGLGYTGCMSSTTKYVPGDVQPGDWI